MTFSPGILTAAALNAAFAAVTPLYVEKAANESVTSNTALQDDDHLVLAVAASTKYKIELPLFYNASASGNLKVAFTFPAGASLLVRGNGYLVGGTFTSNLNYINASSGVTTLSYAGGSAPSVLLVGILTVGATAGNLRLQWAQDTSNASPTTIIAGSSMEARKVA